MDRTRHDHYVHVYPYIFVQICGKRFNYIAILEYEYTAKLILVIIVAHQ